jgi:hypothetical protein
VRVCQELSIGPLSSEQEHSLIDRVEACFDEGWHRDKERENDLRRNGLPGVYCFVGTKKPDREHAALILAPKEEGSHQILYVSNIVPADVPELGYDQYNQILRDVRNKFLAPIADELDLALEFSSSEL